MNASIETDVEQLTGPTAGNAVVVVVVDVVVEVGVAVTDWAGTAGVVVPATVVVVVMVVVVVVEPVERIAPPVFDAGPVRCLLLVGPATPSAGSPGGVPQAVNTARHVASSADRR